MHPHKPLKSKPKRTTHANIKILPPLNRLRRKLRIFGINHSLLDPRSARRRSLDRQLHFTHPVQRTEQKHGFVDGFADGDQAVVLEDAGLEFRAEGFSDVGTFLGGEDNTTEVGVDAYFSAASSLWLKSYVCGAGKTGSACEGKERGRDTEGEAGGHERHVTDMELS